MEKLEVKKMNIIEELIKLKEQILNKGTKEDLAIFDCQESIDLDDKITAFITWYKKELKKQFVNNCDEKIINLTAFIEKVAIWYELRYPDYAIDDVNKENKDVSKVMFKDNGYIKELLGENVDTNYFDWSEFYNAKAFIMALSEGERAYLKRPTYPERVYISGNSYIKYFEVSKNGTIIKANNMFLKKANQVTKKNLGYKFIGRHIEEAKAILLECGFTIDNSIDIVIEDYKRKVEFKNRLLDCIMYYIIERGNLGAKRAFLFAKEFKRDLSIPIRYGLTSSSLMNKSFIDAYIKSGGKTDIICYIDYSKQHHEPVMLQTYIDEHYYSDSEEDIKGDLYQRLVNVLSKSIDEEALKKEEAKKLRIQQKLKKTTKSS